MPKPPIKLAAEIQSRMQRDGKNILTMPWPEFYTEAEIDRFRDKRRCEITSACGALGIVVGYGNNVVSFCHDADFAGGST
ncbi:MAG: hypothetical protein KKD08_10320 [Alphaproteobacteria bacterium]|jgi:hypothetical protein|nr:hypothetical protein [Alphaproteobacteria bacterium]